MSSIETYKGKLTGAEIDELPEKVKGLETRVTAVTENLEEIRAELDAEKKPYVELVSADDTALTVDGKGVAIPARTRTLVRFEDTLQFSNSKSITYVKLRNFKPKNIAGIFQYMYLIEEIDVEGIDVSECTKLNSVFYDCNYAFLKGLGAWDTSKVTDMSSMFNNNHSLKLAVEGWDTRNVTDMHHAFSRCKNIEYLDLSRWDTSKVTGMAGMFGYCENLVTLKLDGWDTSKVTSMAGMFTNLKKISALDVSHFDTSSVTNMQNMFQRTESLRKIDVSKFDMSKVTHIDNMFESCKSMTDFGDLSGWDTSSMVSMNSAFSGTGIKEFAYNDWDVSKVTSMANFLSSNPNLTTVDIRDWKPASKTFYYTFFDCTNLTSVYANKLVTQETTNISSMFYLCLNLKTISMNEWDTRNVTDFSGVFNGCRSLLALDLGTWDTGNATTFRSMFSCQALKTLNLRSFDGTNVENVENMFYGCTTLATLILGEKFFMCGKISSIDFSSLQSWKNGSVQDSLVTNSYDRAANGLQTLTLKLHANTKAVLTDEDKAAMTAKGYIIA